MYPLFLVIFGRSAWTIIMIGFVAGLPPVILKTLEGLRAARAGADQCRPQLQAHAWQQFWKILFPAALPTIFVGLRLGLIFALINIVGVEFLINFGGLGQLINELPSATTCPAPMPRSVFVILVSVVFFVVTGKDRAMAATGRLTAPDAPAVGARARSCALRIAIIVVVLASGRRWPRPGCSSATSCRRCGAIARGAGAAAGQPRLLLQSRRHRCRGRHRPGDRRRGRLAVGIAARRPTASLPRPSSATSTISGRRRRSSSSRS